MAWIYKLRLCLITTAAVLLIAVAVAFSVLRAVLPHATGYVSEVEEELSRQTGLPVSIASIDADMYWLVPRLKLIDVVIYDEAGKIELFRLDEAIFSLAYIDTLVSLSPKVGDISLVGTELFIERHPGNRWVIQGMDLQKEQSGESSHNLLEIVRHTNFSLLDSDIHWHDHVGRSEKMDFIGVNIVIESVSSEHYMEADMLLPQNYGDRFRLITKLSGNTDDLGRADWDVYLEGASIHMRRWLERLNIAGLPEVSGIFDMQLWFSLRGGKVAELSGDILVSEPVLASAGRQWLADSVNMLFNWRRSDHGWRLDVRNFSMARNGVNWQEVSDATVVKNEVTGLYASSSYLRLQDVYGLVDMFASDDAFSQLAPVREAGVAGDIYNLNLSLPSDERANPYFGATFNDLDFVLPGHDYSVKGIDGVIAFSGEDGAELELLSEYVEFDFAGLFRKPLKADLVEGTVTARKTDDGWRIQSQDMHILNMDIETSTRFDVHANKQGPVFIDMQSDFRNAIGSAASGYLPVSVMSGATVDWLDNAIEGGLVENGGFILYGDVERFPYANNEGVFEIAFNARDVTLRFIEDWPEISELAADVVFYNKSMLIENGTGSTYRGKLKQVSAQIPDLEKPRLNIRGNVTAPADDVQRYIRSSGLKEYLGQAMDQFQAEGDVGLELNLDIPLDGAGEPVQAKGEVNFINNRMYFPVTQYTMDAVSGRMMFDGSLLEATDIKARLEGEPVEINVASTAEGEVQETIFHIGGELDIDRLLKRFEWVPEKWFEGKSGWDIFVRIPHDSQQYDILVETQSTLDGVRVNISDALSKQADRLMHVELDLKVLGEAIQADFNSDEVVSLFATRDNDVWDFVVDSDYVRGSGSFVEDLNRDSTVRLELEHIDLPALFFSTAEDSEPVSLPPTLFPSLDITTKSLTWKDMKFDTVRLKSNWHPHGMLISSLEVNSPSLTISGRGSWLSTWRYENESTFNFSMSSSNFGNALSKLGITNRLARCEMNAIVDWKWLAEPYKFSFDKVSGTAHADLRNGEVRDVQPGTGGRLMGLFNVFKLGDRLMLDFGDVYREGFAFDSVTGDFEFNEGVAETHNVELKAAAADVIMLGEIGLANQDYDLMMQVRPHTSAAAFTSGTVYGGPVIGTALVVINKLFGLDELAYDEYRVFGSWDEPSVERISKAEDASRDGKDGS